MAPAKLKKSKLDSDNLPESLIGRLLIAIPAKAPPKKRAATLRTIVLARIHAARDEPGAAKHDTLNQITTVHGASCDWQPFAPKIDIQKLFRDDMMETFLLKMHPGSAIPSHDHHADEECYVIDGSYLCDGVVVGRGDFQISRTGSRHPIVSSPEGCILLIRRPVEHQPRR